MATTTIDIVVPHHPSRSLFERLADWATSASKPLQLSQMIRALAQLNDEQLAKINLTRSEIPAHAHRIVYEGA